MDGQIDLFGNVEQTVESKIDVFRRECEEFIVQDGTGFINGKVRISEYYRDGLLTEEILKKEYGSGGHSVTWKDDVRGFTNHDAKGIECIKYASDEEREMRIVFKWSEVLKLIRDAIYRGKYTAERIKW